MLLYVMRDELRRNIDDIAVRSGNMDLAIAFGGGV